MKAAFFTLGCKVNQYESNAMMEQFQRAGFELVNCDETADVYVINSCTVTASSDSKTRQTVRRFRRHNPAACIVLTGCFPQAFPAKARELTDADIITGSANKSALVSQVLDFFHHPAKMISISGHTAGEPFEPMSVSDGGGRTRAVVKIEDGCERYCSYCIIPTARGPVRSRALRDLTGEIEVLAQKGFAEVVLVGINLSSYGRDIGLSLADAVEAACGVEGIRRVRLGSLEPDLFPEEEVARLSRADKLCDHFHLALQSGCDATLARMNRQYTSNEYRQVTEAFRKHFPGCSITTDILTGFPGESEEEFSQSLGFFRSIGFARAHVFQYSPRPGTAAADFPDQVEKNVKEARSRTLIRQAELDRAAFMQAHIGRTTQVLMEAGHGGVFEGYTTNYIPVRVLSDSDLHGRLIGVRITGVSGEHCDAQLV